MFFYYCTEAIANIKLNSCLNKRHTQEQLVREWYNIAGISGEEFWPGTSGSSSAVQADGEDSIMYGTDDEFEASNNLLLQTDDEFENGDTVSEENHLDCDVLLQTDSETEPAAPTKKARTRSYTARSSKTLTFLDKTVCIQAHKRLYGIGSGVLQRLRGGLPGYTMHENRLEEPKHPTLQVSLKRKSDNCKWPEVLLFFWLIYTSAAEILPIKLQMPVDLNDTHHTDGDPDLKSDMPATSCGT